MPILGVALTGLMASLGLSVLKLLVLTELSSKVKRLFVGIICIGGIVIGATLSSETFTNVDLVGQVAAAFGISQVLWTVVFKPVRNITQ